MSQPSSTRPADSPRLEVTVGPVAHGGHCVARHEGRVIFVRHAIPGETVEIALTENDADAKFWRADVTKVLVASPERVPHFWPEADALRAAARNAAPVGGAEFGHVSRKGQLELKTAVVREQLERLGGLAADRIDALFAAGVEDVDTAGTPEQLAGLGWRTRVGFAVTPSGKLGMHAHRSHDVHPIREMPLALPAINDLGLWELDFTGIERVEVAAPANGSGVLVLLAPDAQLSEKAAGAAVKRVARALAALETPPSVARWNPENGAVEVASGRGWVRETTEDHEFRVTGDGFWQIHRRAPKVLTDAALGALLQGGYLDDGAQVADLYAGAGLFTAPLADAVGPDGHVLSVEGSPGTSRDARKNLHASAQVEIVQGRVEKVLGTASRASQTAAGQRHSFDAVVLDPPRAGAGKAVVRALAATSPSAIAYVSCDPAAFARDVKYFANAGWALESLRAFDLYPHTHHVETVALLVPAKG
ncbi:tRNA/tmRNA/rRNA uracil-C5-methylase (TrmA/RlmC/RlmD family) [Arthrobacter stackebrandtii]|uniref:tRNA/tmRNA/rRNA uracil-C5-methylase (TrmA/RlmC/RlmD family) n=1 Tax=Arthrobacter stackebrandtii TaxID=272161 RepID=A0ABS4Z1R0_9MICC|nr:TRAM domain-containing protein [Arthrobacter stackebrandtii]MBP2414904.1 tRNA/tmRNA/rRNA uracil-C5-methylase (TrmA/RlmC/RlmD family) [Arthrobacter stackebrandtii]PYH00924.1 class I SAM-dependent RNA methyltransferase [Arthrobacter stackebrandtii]